MANRVTVSMHRAVGVLDVAVRIWGLKQSHVIGRRPQLEAGRICAPQGKGSEVDLL